MNVPGFMRLPDHEVMWHRMSDIDIDWCANKSREICESVLPKFFQTGHHILAKKWLFRTLYKNN